MYPWLKVFLQTLTLAGFLFVSANALANSVVINDQTIEPTEECPQYMVLNYAYSSEKMTWTQKVLPGFHAANVKYKNKCIRINTESHLGKKDPQKKYGALGSGKLMELAMNNGGNDIHIVSPASKMFLNHWKFAKGNQNLFTSEKSLVNSPLVLAMWEDMARALGWDPDPAVSDIITWEKIMRLARNPKGWASVDEKYESWGPLKYRQTITGLSNSGTQATYIQLKAARDLLVREGKMTSKSTHDLTMTDLQNQELLDFVSSIQTAAVRYGKSTKFIAEDMVTNGKNLTHVAAMYENLVIEINQGTILPNTESLLQRLGKDANGTDHKVVAVIPEGIFQSDHPFAIVNDNADPDQIAAAKLFFKYLREEPQQKEAMELGFRPSIPSLQDKLDPKIFNQDYGVIKNLDEWDIGYFSPPLPEVLNEIISTTWQQIKNKSQTVILADTSGSMIKDNYNNLWPEKWERAKDGTKSLISRLSDSDTVKLIPYSTDVIMDLDALLATEPNKDLMKSWVDEFNAKGYTSTYDAIAQAYDYLCPAEKEQIINPVEIDAGENHGGGLIAKFSNWFSPGEETQEQDQSATGGKTN